jgi:hypothetical protein
LPWHFAQWLRKKTAVACSAVEGTATSDWAKHRFAEQNGDGDQFRIITPWTDKSAGEQAYCFGLPSIGCSKWRLLS